MPLYDTAEREAESNEVGGPDDREIESNADERDPSPEREVRSEMSAESNEPVESFSQHADEAAGDDSSEAPLEEVTVRKLRINRDGTPVGRSKMETLEESVEDPELSRVEIDPREADSRKVDEGELEEEVSRGSDRVSVGDLSDDDYVEDENDPAEMQDAELPQADLDYTGRARAEFRLTSSVYRMQRSMRQCLRHYYARPENANERSNWGMLHAIMVYGADTKIIGG